VIREEVLRLDAAVLRRRAEVLARREVAGDAVLGRADRRRNE
jgi:hypothetical protein